MRARRVFLFSLQPLLSEGLLRILVAQEDIELVHLSGGDFLGGKDLPALGSPDVIVVAGEEEEQTGHLISLLLNRFSDVPIIWVGLSDSQLHVYSSRILPASKAQLMDTIFRLPIRSGEPNTPSPRYEGETDDR